LPRLQQAFRSIAGRAERWPAPRAVLDNLPRAPDLPELPAPQANPVQAAHYRAILRELTNQLRVKR
jgi:hypothetical protein